MTPFRSCDYSLIIASVLVCRSMPHWHELHGRLIHIDTKSLYAPSMRRFLFQNNSDGTKRAVVSRSLV